MIEDLIFIAKEAGKKILDVYKSSDFGVEYKEDKSPLTLADKVANETICSFLRKKYPDIPIVSEENRVVSKDEIMTYKRFFLIDPLDGTKEFLKKNGEFTVNIALVEDGKPIKGVVYIPVSNEVYYAEKGLGAFSNSGRLKILPKPKELKAVISRSHAGKPELDFLNKMGIKKTVNVGSSIKFCWLATGKADVYIRKTEISTWDIAAGVVICEETGIHVTDFNGNEIDFSNTLVKGIKAVSRFVPNPHRAISHIA